MQDLTLMPADELAPGLLHEAFTAAFADYLIGPFVLSPEQWPQFLGRQAADLSLSRVALRAGQVLAFALVAPRGPERWRLATMGALPAARGSGAAPALLDDWTARAGASGVRTLELEVFAQNERALRLYQGRGFTALHELHGYALGNAAFNGVSPTVAEIDLPSAFAWLDETALRVPDLPLQITPASLRTLPNALKALRRGQAQLVFSVAAPTLVVTVHSLVDHGPDQTDALGLMQQLLASHPGHEIKVPQLQRLDLGGQALRQLGFQLLPLHQLQMVKPLRS
ncbi:GNAT family N-acetyltransferase [Roseateles toxinivorans]|uniref:Acetyltransferase (GNAT) family protein n=1 Tax=Roseateles toxinivorans TaxID=270368 RepID=A0A4V3CTE7_9BURK|nr:GNAT family N-acetyltransferase [Roseateles toxinivorans]TDP71577.1 acetyltransferase (GNAT) family protein [Roseateles toxinivorans]